MMRPCAILLRRLSRDCPSLVGSAGGGRVRAGFSHLRIIDLLGRPASPRRRWRALCGSRAHLADFAELFEHRPRLPLARLVLTVRTAGELCPQIAPSARDRGHRTPGTRRWDDAIQRRGRGDPTGGSVARCHTRPRKMGVVGIHLNRQRIATAKSATREPSRKRAVAGVMQ